MKTIKPLVPSVTLLLMAAFSSAAETQPASNPADQRRWFESIKELLDLYQPDLLFFRCMSPVSLFKLLVSG